MSPVAAMSNSPSFHALIFGASGITGWAITNAALSYPTTSTFARIVGLTNRPLSLAASGLPADSRSQLYSGLDLSKDTDSITEYLKKIPDIEKITHVYFSANVKTKWYGLEFGTLVDRTTPLKESTPRIPSPYGDQIPYYIQVDRLDSISRGKKWKYAEIRPDVIVGFVPNHSAWNIAEPIALYLSLWKPRSPNLAVPFPGTNASYTHLQSNVSSDQLARLHIYASLHPEKTAGQAINIADAEKGLSWDMVWPGITSYFGLEAAGPVEDCLSGEKWVMSNKDIWDEWTRENGLREKVLNHTFWGFMSVITDYYSTFDREFDISKARAIGFDEVVDHVAGYNTAFDKMRAAKIIP